MRVLAFYDEEGWAWWHRAHHVRRNLSPAIEMTILKNGAAFDASAYDLFLLFEHYLLNFVPGVPREKIILGSSCPRLTGEMADRLLREGCKAGMVNNLGILKGLPSAARVYCCQNGVDADLFQPAPALPSVPRACWVGNSKSIGNKGLDLIREACARENVELLVLDKAGSGSENASLTQEQLRDRIYRNSTFYVCASEFEGTPNPMLEAMSCGLPAISTRVGNAPEIIREGENGFLVERSVDAIAAAIRSLLSRDATAMGKAARASILDGWTWAKRAQAYERMFLELASENRKGAAQAAPAPKAGPKKGGFTGMVPVPFLAPKAMERDLYLADLISRAESLKRDPNDFDNVLGAALDSVRIGDYKLAREFTGAAASMTRYYNEVIRDLSLHLIERERKQRAPANVDPLSALGKGTIRVAMLTYNALEYTKQCLHTLLTRTRRPLQIHIRENASRDGTAEWLRNLNHPQVHVEFGAENKGVPGGRNRLIEMIRAVASPEDFVVFLDNDIEMLEGWDDHYLEFFATHPEVGIASAVGQRMRVEEKGRSLADPLPGPAPVDVALGGYACWMRVPAMLAVGGYDENLGLFWHEDDDFCVRALGLGYDVWAVPGAPLIHHGHKSGVALTGLGQGGSPRNQAYLADKWRKLGLVLPSGEIDRSAVARRGRGMDGRAAWGLPEGAFIAGYRMDLAGDPVAQDPTYALESFLAAFGARGDRILSVRLENADAGPRQREFAMELARVLAAHPNIRISDGAIDAARFRSLAACWDVAFFPCRGPVAPGTFGLLREMGIPILATAMARGGDDAGRVDGQDLPGHPLPDVRGAAVALASLAADPGRLRGLDRRARSERGASWIPQPRAASNAPLRILLQNRESSLLHPGGDSMVMDRYAKGLRDLGHQVDCHYNADTDYRKYDLVHIFNLVLPDIIEPMAQGAKAAGVPYVIQALQEDQEAYLGKAYAMAVHLGRYVVTGQNRATRGAIEGLASTAGRMETKTSAFAAEHASVLVCNSGDEMQYVRRLHPGAPCAVIPYGAGQSHLDIGPEAFEKAFGARDFLLCVGRLEVRKNQLALLAALEDEDVTLVLADGGVNYFPDYADWCRAFRRRGRTLFTGRMAPEMLASCYRAARAHILPSWQELPGLVTLEAALHGCAVAATPAGGIREYMGETCAYFEPGDFESIRAAALGALAAPGDPASAQRAARFTWEASTLKLVDLYRSVLSGELKPAETSALRQS